MSILFIITSVLLVCVIKNQRYKFEEDLILLKERYEREKRLAIHQEIEKLIEVVFIPKKLGAYLENFRKGNM